MLGEEVVEEEVGEEVVEEEVGEEVEEKRGWRAGLTWTAYTECSNATKERR